MKKTFTIFLFFLSFTSFAGTVSIQIKDAENKQSISGAVVLIQYKQNLKPGILLPDANGNITINRDAEILSLTVKCIGFNDFVLKDEQLASVSEILLTRNTVNLKEVAITSDYMPTPVAQSAFKITVIDKSQLEQMAAVNVADVMNKLLQSKVSYDPAFGSALSMQGMDMKNVKVLMDGVPVIGRLNGNIDLTQLNLAGVDRIEIVEGPMSVAYGTDAIAGVINLVTQHNNKKTTVNTSAYYESIGTYNTDLNANVNAGKAAFKFSAGRNFFDGWNLIDTIRVLEWKPKEQYFGNAQVHYTLKKWKLAYQLNFLQEKITDKGSVTITPFSAYAFDSYYKTQRVSHVATADYYINAINKINTQIAYSTYVRRKETFYKDMVDLQQSELTTNDFRDTTRFNAWNSRAVWNHVKENSTINYQAGIEINIEQGVGKRINTDANAMEDYAGFVSAEYKPVQTVLLRPGVRYGYNTTYRAPLIPSLNIRYQGLKNQTLRFSYSRGFRAPGIKERYLDFVDFNHNIQGNTLLKAERSHNFQGSYTWLPNLHNVKYQTELKLFYNSVNNLITLAQFNSTSNLYTYVNIGHYSVQGVEWTQRLVFKNVEAGTGIAYTGSNSQNNDNLQHINYYWQTNSNISYRFKKINTLFSVFYKYNGKVPYYRLNSNNEFALLTGNSYQVLDASLLKEFWNTKIKLTAGVKNILNVTSVQQAASADAVHANDGPTSILPGRNYFLKLQYTFL